MIFVCLSHFSWLYFPPGGHSIPGVWLQGLAQVASPMFVTISGMMLGLLYRTHDDFPAVRRKLLDRAVVLLTVVHLLNVVAHLPRSGSIQAALRWCFITDAIGFALLLGPVLVVRLSPVARVVAAIGLFSASWVAVVLWRPAPLGWVVAKELLVGPFREHALSYAFPLLPWFALYLGSTVLGERLAALRDVPGRRGFAPLLARIGLVALAMALAAKAMYWWLRGIGWLPAGEALSVAAELASPWQKLPPSPEYMLLFGGVGLLLASAVFAAEGGRRLAPVLRWLAMLGRNSLFVFVLQYYVYYVVLLAVRSELASAPAWAWFALSILAIALAARSWDDHRGNRWITLSGAWPASPAHR